MSVTRNDLVGLVNDELENVALNGVAETVADGTAGSYLIVPIGYVVSDVAGTLVVTLDGLATTNYTMDYETGTITFATAPGDGVTVRVTYKYLYWRTRTVEQAINAAINSLFPFFYNPTTEVMGATVEHTFTTAGAEVVTMVATTGTSVVKIPRNKYTTYKSGDSLVLRWYGGAPSGTIRANIICRPALVGNILNVTERAVPPIVSYATYSLLGQKQAERLRSDIAVSTVGKGNLSPRQMNDASNSFFLQFQAQCQQGRQFPWSMS